MVGPTRTTRRSGSADARGSNRTTYRARASPIIWDAGRPRDAADRGGVEAAGAELGPGRGQDVPPPVLPRRPATPALGGVRNLGLYPGGRGRRGRAGAHRLGALLARCSRANASASA